LCAQHRRDEEQTNEDWQPVRPERRGKQIGKQTNCDPTAVERRSGIM
jgi:hypothetical protein